MYYMHITLHVIHDITSSSAIHPSYTFGPKSPRKPTGMLVPIVAMKTALNS